MFFCHENFTKLVLEFQAHHSQTAIFFYWLHIYPTFTWFKLTDEFPLESTREIIPFLVFVLNGAIFSPGIIRFSRSPRRVSRVLLVRRLPLPFLPLIGQTDPSDGHEFTDNVSRLLVPNDRQTRSFRFASCLSVIPVLFIVVGFVVETVAPLPVSIWDDFEA